mgnify:CR=1 FL=1
MNNRTRFSLFFVIAWMMLMLPAMAFAQVGGPAPDDEAMEFQTMLMSARNKQDRVNLVAVPIVMVMAYPII